jgi:hypothetical protein
VLVDTRVVDRKDLAVVGVEHRDRHVVFDATALPRGAANPQGITVAPR